MAHAAPDQWVEVRSDHFTVLSDAGEKQARHALDQFELMRWVFQTLFPKANIDPVQPIVVVALRNDKAFTSLEPAAYLAKGQMKLGGLFAPGPDKNYILLNLGAEYEHPYATIYHEYTHLVFAGEGEWMPLWFNEGLAEFNQNTEIQDKQVLLGVPSADDILYLRQNSLIPLDVLFRVDAKSPYYHEEQKGSVFYAESWALMHYLMISDGHHKTNVVGTYLAYVKAGQDPADAAAKAFGDLKTLQNSLQSYIHGDRYEQFLLNSAASPINESSYKVRAFTQPQADAVRADVLVHVQRTDEAQALLESVRRADPNNVQAYETMGLIESMAQNTEQARKWYGEAAKLDSQNYSALYFFAANSASGINDEQDKQIEDSLRAVIRLNPRFAPAYDRLAEYLADKRQNLDEAHLLNIHAVELDPGNLYYRMNTASVLTAMDRYPGAIAVLKAAVKLARTPSEVAMVQNRISEFETLQADRAKAEAEAKARAAEGHAQEASVPVQATFTVVQKPPKHPTESPTGPKHVAVGVIRGVVCSYPATLEFRLEKPGKSISVYSNDYFKIDLSVLGFTPSGSMNPCTDFEGMKASINYAESSDKTIDGQVVAIELRK
jgi:tetratricopeptide (TPR) repeat protein